MNEELTTLSAWFKANKLALIIQKTNYCIFTDTKLNYNANIKIGETNIEQVSFLKREAHIKYVKKEIPCGLYALN